MTMKKVLYIAASALVLLFTACTDKRDIDIETYGGKGLEFVHFENADDSWVIASDDESFDYDITVACTYKHEQDVTYTVSVGENTTGVEGKDFSIPVKSVTIKAGQYLGTVPVKVLYDTVGEGFILELVLVVDDALIDPIYGAASTITVATDKITIDWDWLVGNWNAQDTEGDPYVMAVSKKDENTAIFTNLWGMGSSIEGTVDFDAKTVAFKGPFNLGEAYNGDLMVAHFDEATEKYDDGIFYATLSPLGITITGMGYYLVGGDYDGYDFGTDTTKMTR